jgi:hypothetical protein
LPDDVRYQTSRNGYQREIARLRHVGDAGVAREVADFLILGIDRINAALVAQSSNMGMGWPPMRAVSGDAPITAIARGSKSRAKPRCDERVPLLIRL